MENENRGGGFFAGFLVGAVVAGAVAMLLSQEEARDLLVGKAREAGNFAADASGDLRGKVEGVASGLQSSASELYERGRRVVNDARTNVTDAVDEGVTTADRVRDQLQRKVEE